MPTEDKVKPGHDVRYPEDEGLFVGRRLMVSNRSKNKLEQRLLASGDRLASHKYVCSAVGKDENIVDVPHYYGFGKD